MFKEHLRPEPWILDVKKQLPDIEKRTVISPLHYGETVEIFFVEGIEGESVINGKRYEFKDKNVFFIPPKQIHTSTYKKGGSRESDKIYSFHINIKELESVINIKKLLLKDNHTVFNQAFRCGDFDGMLQLAEAILDEERSFMSRVIDVIRLFEIIAAQKDRDNPTPEYNKLTLTLIDFVEENYNKELSVQTAAKQLGYSAPYFCRWIKSKTGTTFNELLNAVRINHACLYLTNGYSIREVSDMCGFSDPSYFTKVFRRFRDMTPKEYINRKNNLLK